MNYMSRRFAAILSITALVAATVLPAGAGGRAVDAPQPAQAAHDYVTIKLVDPPLASYMGGINSIPRTKPLPGRKLNLSSDAARRYGEHLGIQRGNFRDYMRSRAPRAQVVREYSAALNGLALKLNGESRQVIAAGPGVAVVTDSFLVRPAMNVSPGLINASAAWSAVGGPNKAGEGIKIGIIDTGVDITSPFLSDTGYPSITQIDACQPFTKPGGSNTNKKVFICRVFASGVAPGASARSTLLEFDHGTHVAGTAAGKRNTDGTVAGTSVTIDNMSGIAPKALVGDYNVFPGFGAGFIAFGGSAFSHDIAAALEDAVKDGMDVVNMSLGGGVQGPHDLLAEATNATVDAGVIAAVAAGNSGPGDATVESPGSAEKSLTAGASTNPHFVGIPVTVNSNTFGAALGDFNNFGMVTALYTVTSPALGCTAISSDITGKIALIDRGVCTFTTKIRNAQNAGAIGVLVVNNVAGDPSAMGHDGTSPFPTIPAAMLSKNDGNGIKPSGTASIDGTEPKEFETENADIIAGFSSRGPAPFTFLIKPDATAPGVNVVSSVFNSKFAFFQGTSMATPHLAGSAAVLLQFFRSKFGSSPEIPYPDMVKSAIVNTAKRPVFDHRTGTEETLALTRGGGRVNLAAAKDAAAAFIPVSVSFGLQKGRVAVSESQTVTVFNTGNGTRTYTISVSSPDPGVIITLNGATSATVIITGGGTGTFTVNLTIARTVPSDDYEGDITVTNGGNALRLPWWVGVDRGP